MALTLNEKCISLIDTVEKTLQDQKKHMSHLMRSMYKPICTTIRALLVVVSEQQLAQKINQVHMLHEALLCTHETKKDFTEHIDELIKSWN